MKSGLCVGIWAPTEWRQWCTIARSADCLLRGYRNGYEDKRVQTAEGPLPLKVPQVRNTIAAFESVWLGTLGRRNDKLTALVPQFYVKGMSARDIEATLTEPAHNLSPNCLSERGYGSRALWPCP